MSSGVRVARKDALVVASRLVMDLQFGCERIAVAGSLRRETPDVGDIELVALPQYDEVQDGMFGSKMVNRLDESIDEAIAKGLLAPHSTDPKRGDRYSKLIEPTTGMQVDLFSTTRSRWGIIFLIRTGPASYSQRFVTDLRQRGYHVADGAVHQGNLKCEEQGFECVFVPTPEEADVYRVARWPFIEPEDRR